MPQPEDSPPELAPWGPGIEIFWEDFQPGQSFELGTYLVTEQEIVDFGRRYDPQPFHVDPELARGTIFQGLIASGWHSGAIWMRLYCDRILLRAASLGSPGLERLDWLAPVRSGDELHGGLQVISKRLSRSRPERGLVQIGGTLSDQHQVLKLRLTAWGLFGRRAS